MTDDTGSPPADAERRLRVVTDADAVMAGANAGRADAAMAGPPLVTGPGGPVEPVEPPPGTVDDPDADDREEQDWAWVAEWRESGEPPPWSTGLPLAAFAAVLAGVAVWVLSAGLADRPVLAVVLNLLVAGGLTPAMWLCRNLPVLRWFAAGAAVGVVLGWIAAIAML